MKPTLYIPIGPPASGKSTLLNNIGNMEIISGDNMREKLFGDAALQYTDEYLVSRGYDSAAMTPREKEKVCSVIIWHALEDETVAALKEGKNVGYDGVNAFPDFRAEIIEMAADIAVIHALVIQVDKETCMNRDAERDRHAGEAAIDRYITNIVLPEFSEGFDIIDIYDKDGNLISHEVKEDLQ